MSTPSTPTRRRRATLAETVAALTYHSQIGAYVFRVDRGSHRLPYVVFLQNIEALPAPLFFSNCIDCPEVTRLRLMLEQAGAGTVSKATLKDALSVAPLPEINWPAKDSQLLHQPGLVRSLVQRCTP